MTSPNGGNSYQQDQGAPGHPGGPKITSILRDFTSEALEELAFWLEQRGLHIPISQVLGYQQNIPQSSTIGVGTLSTIAGTTYSDATPAGPSFSGLSDGQYVLVYGCRAKAQAGSTVMMAPSINAAAPSNNDAAQSDAQLYSPAVMAVTKRLSNGSDNTVAFKFASGSAISISVAERWAVVLRTGN